MKPLIIAHRGASADAPENTLAAFRLAWEQGADGIEADFRLTADGHIVCMHDPGTGRVGERNWVVAESTLEQLRQVDVGSHKGPQWAAERIPTLAEVLALVPAGKRIFLEIKSGLAILDPLEQALRESGLDAGQTVMISFVGNVVSGIKKRMPSLKVHLLSVFPEERDPRKAVDGLVQRVKSLNADGLDVCTDPRLDLSFVKALHGASLESHVWTVDDPADAKRLAEAGVDSITTNRPGAIRTALSL